jgi:hypothetical protein
LKLAIAKPRTESKTYRMASLSQCLGAAVAICGALTASSAAVEVLLPQRAAQRVLAASTLIGALGTAIAGSAVISAAGKAKDGRLAAESILYNPENATLQETQQVSVTPESTEEHLFLKKLSQKLADGIALPEAIKMLSGGADES